MKSGMDALDLGMCRKLRWQFLLPADPYALHLFFIHSDVDSDMENDVDSDQMSSDVKSVLKNKNKRMRMA